MPRAKEPFKHMGAKNKKPVAKPILGPTQDVKRPDMFERSGRVHSTNKLVAFLYQLMRDKLTPGEVEVIMTEAETNSNSCYSNGWLAAYANDIARRLNDSSNYITEWK